MGKECFSRYNDVAFENDTFPYIILDLFTKVPDVCFTADWRTFLKQEAMKRERKEFSNGQNY